MPAMALQPILLALTLVSQEPQDTVQKLNPIVVTATRSAIEANASPLPAASLDFSRLRADVRPSFGEVASQVAGVRAVTSGAMITKPVIRGLGGARVLMLDNGHRLEDYSWSDEDGPSLDPRMAERIEVIRGPASLMYGSDAIGGVINAIPEPVPFAAPGQRVRRLETELFLSSNNPGVGAGLEGAYARGKVGASVNLVGHFAGNTSTPACELENTGFASLNGEAALGVHGATSSATLRLARFGGAFKLLEAGGPGFTAPVGCPGGPPKPPGEETGPEREVEDTRIQLGGQTLWRGLTLEARTQFQAHTTVEKSEDFSPGVESETIHLGLTTETVDLLAHHRIGSGEGTIGVSGMTQSNASSGLAPLVPDASTNGVALFAVERIPLGQGVSLLFGLRGDLRRLSADSNAALALGAQTRDAAAWSGDVGLVVPVAPGVSVAMNVGRAFRAPNLFELFSNGPRLGEARYEIGDPTLKPEASLNLDASVRWQVDRFHGEVAVYRNRIDNFIFITPTSQFQPDPDTAAHDSLRVFRYGQARATLWGGEASLGADLGERLSAWARADYVVGDNDTQNSPLPLMPPLRIMGGLEWHAPASAPRRWHVGVDLESVAKQDRLAVYNIPGSGATTYDVPTDSYVLLGLSGGTSLRALGRELTIAARIRNATDASYRDYLSRYKEFAYNAGRTIELRIGTEF